MPLPWMVAIILLAACGSLVFSSLTYSLRDLSRLRLGAWLERHGRSKWLEPTVEHTDELIFVAAFLRMLFNTAIVVFSLTLVEKLVRDRALAYALAAFLAGMVTLFCSIAIPQSLAAYASGEVVGFFIRPLHALRVSMLPILWIMHGIDSIVRNATGSSETIEPEEIEQEILSVMEEGEKEGIVDEQEREMIESVIEFRDTTAGQIMTPRPQIVAIEIDSSLEHIKQTIDESGHSRIPIYNGTLDQIVGILYARDLLRFLGQPPHKFEMKTAMRPPFYVPESKPSRDLLRDFRVQKVHIAIVLDEYGGTAGLVTIEDILEELVGDISDEHEPIEPSLFKRVSEASVEADAKIYLDELNRLTGLSLPEDAGYDTLGGFLSTSLGRIPETGAVFEQDGVKFTVLDAEPQRIKRVRIDQSLQPVGEATGEQTK